MNEIQIIMKITKRKIKSIAKVLAILILFQSCVTVYKSGSLTLEEANDRYIKTKVVTKSGEKLKFKNIEFEKGIYYGVKKIKRQIVKIPLDQEVISEIKIKNRTLSTIVNIPLVFVYVVIVTGLAYSYGTGGL
jgi:hypothetical protein